MKRAAPPVAIQLSDIQAGPSRERAAAARERFTLRQAATPGDFDLAYGALYAEFGPSGEIEAEDALRRWFEAGSLSPEGAAIRTTYHIILARDERGALAAVRDCFVTVDQAARRAIVLLSHNLVLPAYRRSGVSSLMVAAPVALAREALGEAGGQVMLVAEMEMVQADDRASVIRLVAYARGGFKVIPTQALPYAQPDFRDPDIIGDDIRPLPFLAVIRAVDDPEATTLDRGWAEAIIEHLFALHSCHCRADHLRPVRAHALERLAAWPDPTIPLIQPPMSPQDAQGFLPLLRVSVLDHYPRAWWWGDLSMDADREIAGLIRAWSPQGERPDQPTPRER